MNLAIPFIAACALAALGAIQKNSNGSAGSSGFSSLQTPDTLRPLCSRSLAASMSQNPVSQPA